jgi:hypothetical protein
MKKLFVLILLLPVIYSAQELDAKVTINNEKLLAVYKDKLANFAMDLENYLNSTRFTGQNWEFDRIRCTFNIFFSAAANENSYSAQVSITSLRPVEGSTSPSLMLNVVDNNWEFIYEPGQSMYFIQDYDALTDFLDFYAFVIIGFNEDSYAELGGAEYFNQAYNIAILGASTPGSSGWDKASSSYNRRGLIDDILNEKYRTFREDYFDYHYNGLDIFTSKRDESQKNIIKLIKNLEALKTKVDIYGTLIKTFFDAKSGEIVTYLKDYPDKSIFKSLKKVDPPHTAKYDVIIYE